MGSTTFFSRKTNVYAPPLPRMGMGSTTFFSRNSLAIVHIGFAGVLLLACVAWRSTSTAEAWRDRRFGCTVGVSGIVAYALVSASALFVRRREHLQLVGFAHAITGIIVVG